MRVTLVVQKLSGLRGGAERVVIELARALHARGHDVSIATFEPSTERPGYDVGDVELVDLFPDIVRRSMRLGGERGESVEQRVSARGNVWPVSRLKWMATHGLFARRLRTFLRARPQDVVIGFLPPGISAASLAADGLGSRRPRVIASTHNVPSEDFGPSARWDQNPVTRRTNLRALELADAVTVLQPEFVAQLPARVRGRAVVVPNRVTRLTPPSDAQREPLVLGVGRLTDVKRFDVLVEAFARIAEEHPAWTLVIHGDGSERRRLEALIDRLELGDRVRLPGSTADLGGVYDRARILGHPARFEGFGLSVAEAILHGVAVVASKDCPGVDRLVDDGTTGLLVDDGDDAIEAFAAGLRRLITTPLPEPARSEAASQLAERLSPERVIGQWESVIAPTEL